MTPRPERVLVSWVSIGFQSEPLRAVFADPESELYGQVDRVALCHRDAGAATSDKERQAFEATCRELRELPSACRPELQPMPWKTTTSPTDHAAILTFAKGVLETLRADHPEAELLIHLSPGTPSMHAVWLILAHGAFVPGVVRLLQTRPRRYRPAGAAIVEWVDLPSDAWAHIVRATPPTATPSDDDETLWDPARVASPAAKATLHAVERWAPLPAPILLLGERGTGKTTLAHVIRARSGARALKRGEWPVVVCGQFRANPDLARAELFGHGPSAFTGAGKKSRPGILERVAGDTLFLDEIADLDRGTQRLLIAAIEGRSFTRLGETQPRTSAFRLVTATNRPLADLTRGAASDDYVLDEDFFDRISTFTLLIPPLRERREDLPLLWASSLARAARRAGLDRQPLRPLAEHRDLLAALAAHPLPGNLRDLNRAAWRAVAALAAGDPLTAAVADALAGLDSADDLASPHAPGPSLPMDLDAHLGAEQARFIAAALSQAGGNKAKAARLLGLERKTLSYRLRKRSPGGDA